MPHMERYDQSGPQQPEEIDINQKAMCERGTTTGSQQYNKKQIAATI